MCGIAGALGVAIPDAVGRVDAMCEQMAPRGPDDAGVEISSQSPPVVLGSTRLAVIDPSSAGHQPMIDPERRTTIAFNGMVYNFRELRREFESAGERFRSGCDTEVVLRAYGRFGVDCVRRLQGMFAFAIWDERERRLVLARDRLGIKPLYYHHAGGSFAFASQVKALLRGLDGPPRLDPAGIRSFLAFGAVVGPRTAIDGIVALPPATVATLERGRLELTPYWRAEELPIRQSTGGSLEDELRDRVDSAVASHLVTDAPLGVFLSGGLDSSVVAAVAAEQQADVRTVSVVFGDSAVSEDRYSRLVASHIGSLHHRVEIGGEELKAWLPAAFGAMDQPSFDGVNTYVVSRAAAATGLKVALSGLGADELFNGYGYAARVAALERAKRLPLPAARALAAIGPRALRGRSGEKLVAWLSRDYARGSAYSLLRGLFLPREIAELSGASVPTAATNDRVDLRRLSVLELGLYLKNVLLRDTDAMSMGNSLEVRVPYLDDALVHWRLGLPNSRAAASKRMLASAFAHLLPAEIVRRRKHGFLLPLDGWMQRELRSHIVERLASPPPVLDGLIDAGAAVAVWRDYLARRAGWLQAWSLYALYRWAETLP